MRMNVISDSLHVEDGHSGRMMDFLLSVMISYIKKDFFYRYVTVMLSVGSI